ncbi:unnamed protein product (macronuclear) [Paramecium tetraurelia]|uniref:Uncharacterized protein n=1 Tax=Paramecium tetraurelia TaxID=5888 RepID=A0DN62_PARTE|nr:uncharacterized protein GSPATT00018684001 [Paramecium tetraurelia]CAK84479.1 unnamed protein product [Paramecium tetraurelia]|eukprot:XP_001451876.1 hypothetical protein (macronuclear) [Paramecium tetraurelia strain d4-2]
MNLEKHAKALLEYPQSSDDDDYPNYKMKALKYRKDFHESNDQIQKLKLENYDNKQMISELLGDLENHRKKIMILEQELLNQKQLTQDSCEQLRRVKQQKQEDRLLMEQKQFQEKLTVQTNNAIEKLRQHFDQTLSQFTPKLDNR